MGIKKSCVWWSALYSEWIYHIRQEMLKEHPEWNEWEKTKKKLNEKKVTNSSKIQTKKFESKNRCWTCEWTATIITAVAAYVALSSLSQHTMHWHSNLFAFFHCAYGYIFLFVAGLISSLSMDEFLATMIKNGFFSFSFAVFVVLFSFIHVAKWRLFIYYSLLLLLFFRWFHANENNQCWRIVCAWYSTLRRQIVWIGGAWIVQFLLVFFACFLFIFLLFVSCFKKEILFYPFWSMEWSTECEEWKTTLLWHFSTHLKEWTMKLTLLIVNW